MNEPTDQCVPNKAEQGNRLGGAFPFTFEKESIVTTEARGSLILIAVFLFADPHGNSVLRGQNDYFNDLDLTQKRFEWYREAEKRLDLTEN